MGMGKKLKCGKCTKAYEVKKCCNDTFFCKACESINVIESSKDFSLKEWVNFNFIDYLGAIFGVIDKHEFTELKAMTTDEITAGKFTDVDVENLREVLNDGFQKELTIRELTEQIDKKVRPKDLFRTKNGELQFNKKGNKILQLSKQHRSRMIARTESTRIANLGVVEHFKNQGVQEIVWIASIGDRTCPICYELDGRTFPIATAPTPPAHVACRCTVINLRT